MKERTLLAKISASAAAGVLLFLGLWTGGTIVWMESGSALGLEKEADHQAGELAAVLSPLVWNLDEVSILAYLDTKTASSEIVSIEVRDGIGNHSWTSPRGTPQALAPSDVVRRAEVWHGKQAIGTVQVVLSMAARNAQMAQSILVLVLSQILLFLAVLAAVALSWQSVSRRLREMVSVMDAFSRGPDARMDDGVADELGILARGFNLMAGKIRASTQTMEDEIRERTERLMESEKMALVGSLVAGVAHEINTPVGNGITISSWLATRTREIQDSLSAGTLPPEDLRQYLTDVESSLTILQSGLDRTSDLIQSFKKIGADQVVDERRTLPVPVFLQEVISSLQPTLKPFPHRILWDCPPDFTIDNHPGALFQIVTNLILNAHHHAFHTDQEGTIRLSILPDTDPELFQLQVSDDGKGMPPEIQARIFEPFFTTRRQQGGTGLGLSIVETLVRALGGTIDVRSAVGKGTTFVVVLPRRAPERVS